MDDAPLPTDERSSGDQTAVAIADVTAAAAGQTAATVADVPSARSAAAATGKQLPSPVGSQSGLAPIGASQSRRTELRHEPSFEEVLRASELERQRRFVPIVIVMALVPAIAIQFIESDPIAEAVFYAGCALNISAILYLYKLVRNPALYTEGRLGAISVACVIGLYTAVYYFGIYSPAPALITLAVFYGGTYRSRAVGLSLYLAVAIAQAGLGLALLTGLVADRGVVLRADDLSVERQLLIQGGLQLVYLVTFLVARATRVQLDAAVADHDGAVRAVARRDALLEEAFEELARARQIGGPGRFSDQHLGGFVLGEVIGRGGFGEVYAATDRATGTPAAIKLLTLANLAQPSQLTRFVREARAAAALESPHVVKIVDVAGADSPLPYIAMERLHGHDLGHYLRQSRPLAIRQVVDLVGQVALGLEAARAAGIVHRDIKPQNLFCVEAEDAEPVWKILDFGISKVDDEATLTGDHVLGTPMYMSPEQAKGEPVSHRTDVYALATVAYRALTGQPPFSGKDSAAILYRVVHRMPAQPSQVALAPLPAAFDRVLLLGMAKNPADRFERAVDLAEAIARAVGDAVAPDVAARAKQLAARHPWSATPARGASDRR